MNDSTEDLLHETLLHDTLHTHVRESDMHAGAHLTSMADDALRIARRRQRLTRAGIGVFLAAAVATDWVVVADDEPLRAHVVQPAEGGGTPKAGTVSLLPVTSLTQRSCAQGDGGYAVHATEPQSVMCIHAAPTGGMSDVRVASAKAKKGTVDGSWQVKVTLTAADGTRFATLTGSLALAPPPRNEFAIVVDGRVWGTPVVAHSLTGGAVSTSSAPTPETSPAPWPATSPSGWIPPGEWTNNSCCGQGSSGHHFAHWRPRDGDPRTSVRR